MFYFKQMITHKSYFNYHSKMLWRKQAGNFLCGVTFLSWPLQIPDNWFLHPGLKSQKNMPYDIYKITLYVDYFISINIKCALLSKPKLISNKGWALHCCRKLFTIFSRWKAFYHHPYIKYDRKYWSLFWPLPLWLQIDAIVINRVWLLLIVTAIHQLPSL